MHACIVQVWVSEVDDAEDIRKLAVAHIPAMLLIELRPAQGNKGNESMNVRVLIVLAKVEY